MIKSKKYFNCFIFFLLFCLVIQANVFVYANEVYLNEESSGNSIAVSDIFDQENKTTIIEARTSQSKSTKPILGFIEIDNFQEELAHIEIEQNSTEALPVGRLRPMKIGGPKEKGALSDDDINSILKNLTEVEGADNTNSKLSFSENDYDLEKSYQNHSYEEFVQDFLLNEDNLTNPKENNVDPVPPNDSNEAEIDLEKIYQNHTYEDIIKDYRQVDSTSFAAENSTVNEYEHLLRNYTYEDVIQDFIYQSPETKVLEMVAETDNKAIQSVLSLEELAKISFDNSSSKDAIVVGKVKIDQNSLIKEIESLNKATGNNFLYVSSDTEEDFYAYCDADGLCSFTNTPTDVKFTAFQVTAELRLAQRSSRGWYSRLTPEHLKPYIEEAAILFDLDPALIAAVIKAESAFDPQAVSWAGAQGLMQLIPSTARLVGCSNSFDPRDNIFGGSRYLRMMLDRFNGNWNLAIAAYNSGPERVAKVGQIPNIKETQNYVKIVLANYNHFKTVEQSL